MKTEVFMSRRFGLPIPFDYDYSPDGSVLLDDVVLGVGTLRTDSMKPKIIIGFYRPHGDAFSFRFSSSFDVDGDNMSFRPIKSKGSQAAIETDRAMAFWVISSLLSHSGVESLLSLKPFRDLSQFSRIGARQFFSSERRVSSMIQLFNSCVQPYTPRPSSIKGFAAPGTFNSHETVSGEIISDAAIRKLTFALCKDFHKCRGIVRSVSEFLSSYTKIRSGNISSHALGSIVDSVVRTVRNDSSKHIRSLDISEEIMRERLELLDVSCDIIEMYGKQANVDGSIQMSAASGKEREISDKILFDMFVPPFPISVSDQECDTSFPEVHGYR